MDLLVIGASGLLGSEILLNAVNESLDVGGTYYKYPFRMRGVKSAYMDLSNPATIEAVLNVAKPRNIIISGAMKDVDSCERNPEMARIVNINGTQKIVEWAKKNDSKVYLISTDYVFDGAEAPPGGYTEMDPTFPLNVYGKTKLEAENIVLDAEGCVFRVALLFGNPRLERTKNFGLMVLDSINENRELNLYTNLTTSPTYVPWAASTIMNMLPMDPSGLFHISGKDIVSRYEFGLRIARAYGQGEELIRAVEFKAGNGIAPRPRFSALKPSDLLGASSIGHMPPLDDCIDHMISGYISSNHVGGE